MKNILKTAVLILIIHASGISSVTGGVLPPPPPGNDGGGGTTSNDPGVPIDGGISALLLAGAGFAYRKINKHVKAAKKEQI